MQNLSLDTKFLVTLCGVLLMVYIVFGKRSCGAGPRRQGRVGRSGGNNVVLNKVVVKNFYAPWCGWSKRLLPVWAQLEQTYASNPSVSVEKVDCDQNPQEALKNQVEGFPTIILFKSNGQVVKYRGDRSLDDLKRFISQNQ